MLPFNASNCILIEWCQRVWKHHKYSQADSFSTAGSMPEYYSQNSGNRQSFYNLQTPISTHIMIHINTLFIPILLHGIYVSFLKCQFHACSYTRHKIDIGCSHDSRIFPRYSISTNKTLTTFSTQIFSVIPKNQQ